MAEKPQIRKEEILSDEKYVLKKVTYELNGESQTREVYERGNAATILLYNNEKGTVLLTRQFRLPSFLNGNKNGMLIEACAGLLDDDDPETCARREAEEETGYRLREVKKIYEAYSSPGGITEILHFFVAPYKDEYKVSAGGGLQEEQEKIEILELPFSRAINMIETGEIKDAKTIILIQYVAMRNLIAG
jgi:GDP-mannose pyrophosphatase NudK